MQTGLSSNDPLFKNTYTWWEPTGQDYARGVTSGVEIPNISEFWGVKTGDGLRWDLNPLPTFSWGW